MRFVSDSFGKSNHREQLTPKRLRSLQNRSERRLECLLVIELDQDAFTRVSVVACGSVSLPSMIALQVVVIVSALSKWMLNACMCDSLVGSMPQVESKSNLNDLASEDASVIAGRLP